MHQKPIRNVSEMYPKFNLFSLDLSHSNTIKGQIGLDISDYITYMYPKFIPKGQPQKMTIFGFLADENGLKLDQIPQVPRYITHKIQRLYSQMYISRWIGLASDWNVPTGEM